MKTRILVTGAFLLLGSVAAFADGVKETVHVVITGGANAGTYDVSTDRGGCSAGFTGAGSWGNQLSQPKEKDPKKLNSLQLIVPDAKKAANGTKEFFLMVGFGPLLQRAAEYTVETRAGQKGTGSGTVTVMDHGTTGMVRFDVTTAAKVHMVGSIDCKEVGRNQ